MGSAFLCGSFIGNKLAGKVKAQTIEKLLGVVLTMASLAVLIHAWML
jgi:uncharacterized membrane protein YfcA